MPKVIISKTLAQIWASELLIVSSGKPDLRNI